MRKNTKKLSTLGLALALLLSIFTTSAYAVSLPTSEVTSEPVTGETSQLDDSIIAEATTEDATDTTNLLDGVIGEGKTVSSEGSYDYQYWKLELYGSGASCWTRLNYGGTATLIETNLVVERSKATLGHYDYYTLHNTNRSASTCYSRWDDGSDFVALSATGSGVINGTTVDTLSVSGWW